MTFIMRSHNARAAKGSRFTSITSTPIGGKGQTLIYTINTQHLLVVKREREGVVIGNPVYNVSVHDGGCNF